MTVDPDVRYTGGTDPMAVATFTIAVDRKKKKDEADFIWCVAFQRTAELFKEYVKKGDRIAIEGRWHTDSYQKDGEWKHVNKCIIDKIEFLENKKDSQPPINSDCEGYSLDDDDLPF